MKKLMIHTGLAVSVVLGAFTTAQAGQKPSDEVKDYIELPSEPWYLDNRAKPKALPTDADKNIGILFLYSEGAKKHKGMPYLVNYIQTQTDTFAKALKSSGSDLTVSIAGIEPVPVEYGSFDGSVGDVLMHAVSFGIIQPTITLPGLWPTKMQAMGADNVVIINTGRPSDAVCGKAFIANSIASLEDANRNFFVSAMRADCPVHVLAHEIGHQLGGHHTSEEASSSFVPYAAPHKCGSMDTIMLSKGKATLSYSNPSESVGGAPCGNADTADMARVMREHAPYMAAKSNTVSILGSKHSFVEKRHEAQEGSGSVTLVIKRDKTEKETRLYLTTSSESASSNEYSLSTTELVFPVGVDQLSVDFNAVDDGVTENDETVTVTLNPLPPHAVEGENPSVDVVIKSYTPIKHSFMKKRHEVQEGSGSVTLTVKRDKTEKETTVHLKASSTTASSNEYFLSTTELVFPVGVDQLTVDFNIVDDSVAESDETVTVTLNPLPPYAVQGENPSVDVVIKNDDKAPTVVTVTPNSGGGGSTGVWLLLAMASVLFARKVKSEK